MRTNECSLSFSSYRLFRTFLHIQVEEDQEVNVCVKDITVPDPDERS